MTQAISNIWIDVCSVDDIAPNTGVCAKVDNQQIAIFYLQPENELRSIANYDPIAEANILARGIIGEVEGKRVVASPLYKQHFCLHSGVCLQDEQYRVPTYQTRITNDRVQVLSPTRTKIKTQEVLA